MRKKMENNPNQEDLRYFFTMLGIPDQTERANGIGAYLADIGSLARRLYNVERRFYGSIVELPGGGIIRPGREEMEGVIREIVSITEDYMLLESSMPDSFEDKDVVLMTLIPSSPAYASSLTKASMKNIAHRLDMLETALNGFYPGVGQKINKEAPREGKSQGGKVNVGYV